MEEVRLTTEEDFFIKDIISMEKRSGKKFAFAYLDDIEKRPCMALDTKRIERGQFIRDYARKLLKSFL